MEELALIISTVALFVSLIALKISRDSNIINYLRINFDLLTRFRDLDENDKPFMRKIIKRNKLFKAEDDEIRAKIMKS